MGSIIEILNNIGKDDYINNKTYRAVDIESVYIDNTEFKNYGAYSFIWEKSYVTSPERSASGSIGNLNSYATFVTPHLILDFSLMSIDDYRTIMRMHYEKNEFIVKCYDPIYNETIKVKMYFATEEMAKLYTISQHRLKDSAWEDWVDLVGVREYKVELIGTNNSLDLVSVRYLVNAPSVDGVKLTPDFAIDGGENDVYKGEEVIIGYSTNIPEETFGGKFKFKDWNILPSPTVENPGQSYVDGYTYNINEDTTLYAQWETTENYTLTYNYGLADPVINEESYSYVTSKTIKKGATIDELPTAALPKVKYTIGGETDVYEPYKSIGWWKVPVKPKNENADEFKVNKSTTFSADTTIYLLHEPIEYNLNLFVLKDESMGKKLDDLSAADFRNFYDDESTTEDESKSIPTPYNTPLNLPYAVRVDYTFDGWYTSLKFAPESKFVGNMPPFPEGLTLYSRWVKKS